nr:heme-binding protein [Sphingomonas sp. Y57]
MNRTVQQLALSDDALDEIVAAARSAALAEGIPVSIALVDAAGNLVRFVRQHGAILVSVGLAQDKAHTAISFGIATHLWGDFIESDPQIRYGIPHIPRHIAIGGGVPIRVDGHLVGGLGISGGHYEQDRRIAEAAVAHLA